MGLHLTGSTVTQIGNAFVGRQRDDLDHHNEVMGGGAGQAIPDQGTFYGNTVVGGGGQAGASPNVLTGQASLRTIVGGYDNHIGASLAGGIVHGMHHVIDDLSTHAFLAGGSTHTTTDSDYSTGVGGTGHVIGATGKPANYAGIFGGQTNTVQEYHSGILAGLSNTIGDGGVASAVLAGQSNVGYGSYSVLSGDTNLIGSAANPTYGDRSAILGGLSNQLGQTANAAYSAILAGRDHRTDAQYTGVLGGRGARPAHLGAQAQAMGYVTTPGDRQITRAVVRREITATIATGLYLDTTGSLVMPDNTSWGFTFDVLARRSSDGATAHWIVSGTAKRGSGAGTTALVGTYAIETLGNDVSAWVCDVIADTTNGGPLVRVKPDSATAVSCVAEFRANQVTA